MVFLLKGDFKMMKRSMTLMDIVKTREYHPPTDSNLEAAYADGFLHAVNNSSYDNSQQRRYSGIS